MSGQRRLIHTRGDLVLVMADGGQVRAYEVAGDGGLVERDPAVATLEEERAAASGVVVTGDRGGSNWLGGA